MSEINSVRINMLAKAKSILDDPILSSTLRTSWEQYRDALQDFVEIPDAIFPNAPDEPTYPITIDQATTRTDFYTNQQTLQSAYQTMIARLEQIQTTTNPTNAQVIQAVKDEALYIERLIKVLRYILS